MLRPLGPRLRAASLSATILGALAALTAACADQATAPGAALAPDVHVSRDVGTTGTPVAVQGLLRTAPLAQNVVVVKTLSSGGGGIAVPGTDFQLQVPNGAIPGKSMTFTITAYAGSVVAYDFQPHGVKFLKPLKAVQQLGHTNWKSFNLPAGFYQSAAGAYFADTTQVDWTTGLATVDEFMPTDVSVGGATMTWDVPHFSGYIVSWSRH
jgi:hypothetical protein